MSFLSYVNALVEYAPEIPDRSDDSDISFLKAQIIALAYAGISHLDYAPASYDKTGLQKRKEWLLREGFKIYSYPNENNTIYISWNVNNVMGGPYL